MPKHAAAKQNKFTDAQILAAAREVISAEECALKTAADGIGADFIKAARTVAAGNGRLIVAGLGKSGHIGRKLAATLASTGTPSFFVHPTEALHGDLGMITKHDIVLALSYSGQTEEVNRILEPLKKAGVKIIAMTGNKNSGLAKLADMLLPVCIKREACPYNLAPTSSTTAMLAVGDALAITLMKMRGFKAEDFAVFHPGGSLGKLLTQHVKDIMFKGKNPTVPLTAAVQDALLVMTKNKSGAASVVDARGRLKGYFTDGDLRRAIQRRRNILNAKITEVMTKNPFAFTQDIKAVDAAKIISERKFDNAPVVDAAGKVIGFLDKDNLIDFIALIDKK
ncbi:MAG: KpsF/GutQ family sugar-phosphate isomerase [Elusimicrobiota bacterium]|jgi:arabinose-5-phosphate isomerase|nr:KpsF/GutQ family sugar-phosphate isomerase [Elusimicrobiota bacterium]